MHIYAVISSHTTIFCIYSLIFTTFKNDYSGANLNLTSIQTADAVNDLISLGVSSEWIYVDVKLRISY